MLTDPDTDYTVAFFYALNVSFVVVTERYVDTCCCPVMKETHTNVEIGDTYFKIAPKIRGFAFVGYTINNGPLQKESTVVIENINADTLVTFIYCKKYRNIISCKNCCNGILCKNCRNKDFSIECHSGDLCKY